MMDQGDVGSQSSRRMFEVLVHHLRELRERGLIDMADRSVTRAADTEDGVGCPRPNS